jgi:hypothetical protein
MLVPWRYNYTNLRNSLAVQAHHDATKRLFSMLNVKVDLRSPIRNASKKTRPGYVTHLASDLRAARLLRIFSLNQGETHGKDHEKGQEKAAEIHAC